MKNIDESLINSWRVRQSTVQLQPKGDEMDVDLLKDVWQKTNGAYDNIEANTNENWDKLEQLLGNESKPVYSLKQYFKYAAAIVIICISGMVAYQFLSNNSNTYESQAQNITIELKDHTLVELKPYSKIRVSDGFGSNNREVSLIGSADFEVTKNKSTPFKVNFGENKVQVMGTKFLIRNYQYEQKQLVELYEGSISLSNEKHTDTLNRGERFWVNVDRSFTKQKLDLVKDKENSFSSYVEMPLSIILNDLKRDFNFVASVSLSNQKLNERYTVQLPKSNLKNSIEILEKISGLSLK